MESKNMQKCICGFTLTELLVTIVIIGILVMIAYPSYQAYVRKSRRADATTTLLAMQMAEERYRFSQATYGTLAQVWGGKTASQQGYYTLSISNTSATAYTLTATAAAGSSQVNDSENGASCTPMVLSVSNGVETRTPAACWQ